MFRRLARARPTGGGAPAQGENHIGPIDSALPQKRSSSSLAKWRDGDRRKPSCNDENMPPTYRPVRAESFPVAGDLDASATSEVSTHQAPYPVRCPELWAAFPIGGAFFQSNFSFQLLRDAAGFRTNGTGLASTATGSTAWASHNSPPE